MEKYTVQCGKNALPYYSHGDRPQLLFIAGIHGDEFEITSLLAETISAYLSALPSFFFIPEVSPSAQKLKTRCNCDGVDVNRKFFDNSTTEEVCAVMSLIKNQKFQTCISFHEDPFQEHFYLYDTENLHGTRMLNRLHDELAELGVQLLNGIDDPHDPILGHEFADGYKWIIPQKNMSENGTLERWALCKGITKRVCIPEIPGKVAVELKKRIIEAVFKHLIVPFATKSLQIL